MKKSKYKISDLNILAWQQRYKDAYEREQKRKEKNALKQKTL